MKTIYLVACSKKKRDCLVPAQDLYIGDLFQKSRAYVRREAKYQDSWGILSARHGLVQPDTLLSPYDDSLRSLNASKRREWASKTLFQLGMALADALGHRPRVVFLAGQLYREYLIPVLDRHGCTCEAPMHGLGIGQQKAWLKAGIAA